MIEQQKVKSKHWKDEQGQLIPTARLTKLEIMSEQTTNKILKKAMAINKQLADFKEEVRQLANDVLAQSFIENNTTGKDHKGNFTFYNFNRTIKVEVSVKDRIAFDDLKIQACQEKLNEFIQTNTTTVDDFFKGIIQDAFTQSSGRLDVKKVLSLKKHKSRTKNKLYHEAMELLDQAIRRPDSKTYFKIYYQDKNGKYMNVDLNLSSI
jgi:hypothetical protein